MIGWFEGVFSFSLTLPPSSHEVEVTSNQTLCFQRLPFAKACPANKVPAQLFSIVADV